MPQLRAGQNNRHYAFTSSSGLPVFAAFVLVVAMVLLTACSGSNSQITVLRVGHTLEETHPVHSALVFMANDLKKRSNNKMQIKLYSSGQLGSERELIELLQIGALDITKVSAAPLEGFAPIMGVFGLPYLFRDNDHYWQVLDGEIGAEILEALEPKRLVGLGYFDAGARSFYSKKEPFSDPSKLTSKKIRVMNSRMAIDAMAALGASATPIPGGEVYTALQQGVVDAAENNPPTYLSSRHYEVAPYFVIDEHTSIPDVILLSQKTKKSLSSEEFSWLQESMKVTSQFQRRLWKEATQQALIDLEAAGVTILYPDLTPFREPVAILYSRQEGTEIGVLAERIKAVGKGDHEISG